MKIFRNIFCCALAMLVSAAAHAQNFNPSVSVTKDYEGKLLEVDKPAMKVNVPDSVTRFNLDFDYTVLDSKFKGVYEFKAYELDVRPKPDSYREKQLWLRAGLGFSLHPTLDLIYSPRLKGDFRMSVYARHDSYYGKYANVQGLLDGTMGVLAKDDPVRRYAAWYCGKDTEGKDITAKDYDTRTNIGVNGRFDWQSGAFSFDASYLGISTQDQMMYAFKKNYNAFDLNTRVKSVRDDSNYLLYDVQLGIRYGSDNLKDFDYASSCLTGFGGKVNEFLMNLDARVGPVIMDDHGVFVDVDWNMITYGKSMQTHSGNIAFTPKYVYNTDRMNLEAGVRFDFFLCARDGINPITNTVLYHRNGQIAYPDIRFDYAIFKDWLDVYARIGGGNTPMSYSRTLERNHHFSVAYNAPDRPIFENTKEAASTLLGLRGNVGQRVYWDVNGGWLYNYAAPLDAVYQAVGGALPTVWYGAYNCAFVSLKTGFRTEKLEIGGWFDYRWTDVYKSASTKKLDKHGNRVICDGVVEPIRFSGGIKAEYNWKNRIFLGVDCVAASNRRVFYDTIDVDGTTRNDLTFNIPWYLDLGLTLNYKLGPRLSLWAEINNLLGQSIQHNIGFAEFGPYFTVGICLNL